VCAKEAVVLTPSASSTSALPAREVTAREPCLATGRPAPAMTKAAAVETLKVFAGLDPVPAVSMKRAWRDDNGTARARIAAAMPASSSTDSPFTAIAASAGAIFASVAAGRRNARALLHRPAFYSHGGKRGRELRVGRVRMEKRVQEFSCFLSSKMFALHQVRRYFAQCHIADCLLKVHLAKFSRRPGPAPASLPVPC